MFLLGVCMQAGGGLYLGLSEYRLHVAFMFASFGEMEIRGGGGGRPREMAAIPVGNGFGDWKPIGSAHRRTSLAA